MAGVLSAANIRIGAEIKDLMDGVRKAQGAMAGFTLDLNKKLVDGYKRADKEQTVFTKGITRLGDEFTSVAKKIGMFGGIPALLGITKAYKDFADLQKLEIGLKRFGGSLQEIRELAKLPNIGVFDGASLFTNLRATGMEAGMTTRTIKAFANALTEAGRSAVDLAPAMWNIQQFMSTKHINQVDLRQLANRVPQTMEILKKAFGTTDVAELNKMPIEKFIQGFVAELEKIPPVAGGAGMAMEQFGDTMLFASANIGEMIDKAFNVTGVINSIGDVVDDLTDNLRALSPEAQKSVLAIGSLTLIIPAVTAAIGGAIKVIPLLLTGFGAISGTVVAVVAVIGIGVAAIISNWEKVKAAIQSSGYFTNLVTVVKSSLGIVAEAFKVVVNLVQGDWANLGNALVNILKNAANGVVSILGGLIKTVVGVLGELNHVIMRMVPGMGGLTRNDGITGWINNSVIPSLDKLTNKLKFDVPDATKFVSSSMSSMKDTVKNAMASVGSDVDKTTDVVKTQTKAVEDMIIAYRKYLQERASNHVRGAKTSIDTGEKSTVIGAPDLGVSVYKDAISSMNTYVETMKTVQTEYGTYARNIATTTADLNEVFAEGINQITTSVVIGFSEMVGEAIAGANNIHEVGRAMMGTIGQLIANLGKALVGASKIGIALKAAFANPTTAAIVGVGMIALGTALKASMQKQTANVRFAKGGMAFNEMQAIVGDNPNSRFDPEMIAPYSKVDESIANSIAKYGGAGGTMNVQGNFILRGNDLELAIERVMRKNKDLKGR